jgi:hypothetical protein
MNCREDVKLDEKGAAIAAFFCFCLFAYSTQAMIKMTARNPTKPAREDLKIAFPIFKSMKINLI